MPHKRVIHINRVRNACADEEGRLMLHTKGLPKIGPKAKRILNWVFIFVILLESSFLFVQLYKTYSTKSAHDLSLPALYILVISNVIWILVAIFVLSDVGILLSGVLYVSSGSALIVGAHLYS